MSEVLEVLVPDIGDFTDVPVIEILVAPGEEVAAEAPLVTLESDKATMDVPAPVAGAVQELKVKVGDTVSEGTPILTLAVAAEAGAPEAAAPSAVETAVAAEASAPVQRASEAPPAEAAGAGDGAVYASPAVRRLA